MLKNEFRKSTRDLFDMGGYMIDFEDGRNDANALHHILGRVSNSPYNACPLNNARNHQPEGRKGLPAIHSFEVRKKYLLSTMSFLEGIGYEPNDKDKAFINNNKKYYGNITL